MAGCEELKEKLSHEALDSATTFYAYSATILIDKADQSKCGHHYYGCDALQRLTCVHPTSSLLSLRIFPWAIAQSTSIQFYSSPRFRTFIPPLCQPIPSTEPTAMSTTPNPRGRRSPRASDVSESFTPIGETTLTGVCPSQRVIWQNETNVGS